MTAAGQPSVGEPPTFRSCLALTKLLGHAAPVKAPTTIRALFSLPGFVAMAQLARVFGDRYARVIRLRRRKKPRSAGSAAGAAATVTTSDPAGCGTCRWLGGGSTWSSSGGGRSEEHTSELQSRLKPVWQPFLLNNYIFQ